MCASWWLGGLLRVVVEVLLTLGMNGQSWRLNRLTQMPVVTASSAQTKDLGGLTERTDAQEENVVLNRHWAFLTLRP